MAAIRTVRTATLDVGVIERGPPDGPPVVVDDYPDDPRCYDRVAAELEPNGDGFRILLPFPRSYGSTRFLHSATPTSATRSWAAWIGADAPPAS